jgi:hypothetical protein
MRRAPCVSAVAKRQRFLALMRSELARTFESYAAFLRAEGRKKGELTLDDDEFRALLQFIADNYEPFRAGAKRYISIEDRSNREMLNTYASFFAIRTSNS